MKTQINIKAEEEVKELFENLKEETETQEDFLIKLMNFYKQNNVKKEEIKVNFNFYDNLDKTLEETIKSSYNSILSSIHSHNSIMKSKEMELDTKLEMENQKIKELEEKIKELELENQKITILEFEKKDLEIQLEEKNKIIKSFELVLVEKTLKLVEKETIEE